MPGCGTFENYDDAGSGYGASFDGRKKAQTIGEDYAPQNFLMDI
jgi:pyruvate-formate lyase